MVLPYSSKVDLGLRLITTKITNSGLDTSSGGNSSSSKDKESSSSLFLDWDLDIYTKVRVGDSCCDRSKCDDLGGSPRQRPLA